MSDIAIRIEHLYKQYRLGVVSTGTLSHDLNRWWHTVRGKEDPYLKISTKNVRTSKGDSEYVWALEDINFEVKKGEVLGIIGRNGAGKSTLLKILSKVTGPTKGCIKVNGRIASLLEVGTGFHPELTGRENIFLNGAILGMTKAEIRSKFDEIVDFSGVERYIDTPVKRYSSGMHVRLAFAVAAHLEPETLIVDEVLAVGDAEFQKKCLGKMKDVSDKDGRTVLFVSHNMTAIQSLCQSAILLKQGQLVFAGSAWETVKTYLAEYSDHTLEKTWDHEHASGNEFASLKKIIIIPANEEGIIKMGESFEIEFHYETYINEMDKIDISFQLYDEMGNMVFDSSSMYARKYIETFLPGYYIWKCRVPENIMNEGAYNIGRLMLMKNLGTVLLDSFDLLRFDIINTSDRLGYLGGKTGVIKPKLDWILTSKK